MHIVFYYNYLIFVVNAAYQFKFMTYDPAYCSLKCTYEWFYLEIFEFEHTFWL